jgi:hypothetical protein
MKTPLGILLAFCLLLGICLYAVKSSNFGYVVIFGLPFLTGILTSRYINLPTVIKYVALLSLIIAVALSVIYMHLGGALCGVIFCILIGVPFIFGNLVGQLVTKKFSSTSLCFTFLPMLCLSHLETSGEAIAPVKSVTTIIEMEQTPEEVFSGMHFYEGSKLNPPTILSIHLPKPLRTEGSLFTAGSEVKCVYNKGYLVKHIVDVETNKRIYFKVVEQVNIENRSIDLVSGEIVLEETQNHQTLLKMTTSYRPKLSARLLWSPIEETIVHALHQHIANGVASVKIKPL